VTCPLFRYADSEGSAGLGSFDRRAGGSRRPSSVVVAKWSGVAHRASCAAARCCSRRARPRWRSSHRRDSQTSVRSSIHRCSFKHSSQNLPLKLSTYAFSIGLPGRMKRSVTPWRYGHPTRAEDSVHREDGRIRTTRCRQPQRHHPGGFRCRHYDDAAGRGERGARDPVSLGEASGLVYHEVSRGCLDSTLVHPREVFRRHCWRTPRRSYSRTMWRGT